MATYDREHDGYRVFVGGISPRITKEELKHEFDRYGRINDVWVARNPPGFGFIVYKHSEDAEKAVRRMDKKRAMGSILRVEHANQPYRGSLGGRSRRDRSRSPPRKVSRRSRSRSKHRRSRSRDRDYKKNSSRSRSLSGRNDRSKRSKRDRSRSGSNHRKSSDKEKGRSSRRDRSSEERSSRAVNNKNTSPSRSPSNNGAGDSRDRSHDDEIVNNGKVVNQSVKTEDANSTRSSREPSPMDNKRDIKISPHDFKRSPSHEREEEEEDVDNHHRSPSSRHEDDDEDSPRQSRENSVKKRDSRSGSQSRRSASPADEDSRSE